MTKKSIYSKLKTFAIIFLIALLSVSVCAFSIACGEDKSSDNDSSTSYTYTETDTDIISNESFAYGTYNKADTSFPITSSNGWTRATDNSSAASNVNSGVVSTTDTAWDKLFATLYSDSDFSAFFDYKFKDQVTAEIREEKEDESYSPTTSELKEKYKALFINPSSVGEDAFIYMLNNYATKYYGFNGTAQRIRSSSTVSVNKGEIYKLSVSVKTLFVSGSGANIRLVNTVNGTTQAEFRINGIKDTEWTEYTVYFKANADYDCSFTVMLGLGYGNGDADAIADYAEGTVFFDEVKVEKVDAVPEDVTNVKTLAFSSDENAEFTVDTINTDAAFVYDMNYDLGDFFTDIDLAGSLSAAAVAPENASFTLSENNTVITLNDYSTVTLTIKNGDLNFKADAKKYALLSFKIKNQLNKLSSTAITVNVFDVLDGAEEKRAAIASFSDISDDFVLASLLIKNNFEDVDREFYIQIVIGPTDAASVSARSEFAKGVVEIKDLKIATGYISPEDYPDNTDDIDYKVYSALSSNANATVALYAGYNADYSESGSASASYSLNTAKGSIGWIINNPSAVADYYGIVANHQYVTGISEDSESDLETAVNDRTYFNNEGYAGLINTAYMDNYSDKANLKATLNGLYDNDNDIQPIVIFNNYAENVKNHYGFVGGTQTVSASSYAKVTVKVKTAENAVAYIYLVDVSKEEKEVMTFADFTSDGKTYSAKDNLFMVKVDANSPVSEDGWVEVSFYIGTGATAKSFRVEVWNGGRDGSDDTASKGYVFINDITVNTSSAFTEPESIDAAVSTSNPIFDMFDTPENLKDGEVLVKYTRELTATEIKFNSEYPDNAVSYSPAYIWAANGTSVYAIFNTVDPVETDPYESLPEEETGSGCAQDADPSTFWLSFSSILLAAVIVLALIALIVKNYAKKIKANKSDVKAQYKIKSREESQKAILKAQNKANENIIEENADDAENTENTEEEVSDQSEENDAAEDEKASDATDETTENNADEENAEDKTTIETDYVYGEVQDFGDMTLETEDKNAEENKNDDENK